MWFLPLFLLACSGPGPATPGSPSARAAEALGPVAESARRLAEGAARVEALADPEVHTGPLDESERAALRDELGALESERARLRELIRRVEERCRAPGPGCGAPGAAPPGP